MGLRRLVRGHNAEVQRQVKRVESGETTWYSPELYKIANNILIKLTKFRNGNGTFPGKTLFMELDSLYFV